VFVVTPARCGSTLLRYLLDSHPDLVSPPELNLSALLQHLVEVWNNTNIAIGVTAANGAGPAATPPAPEVYKRAKKAVDEIMVSAANATGASVYCDKSLTTIDHLATVTRCYPKASLIFLYRYPLDMIASGLEASKWGFNAFGFQPFVAANPGNFVAALANYWIDRVSKMVEFERTCELGHARIYYELLCDDPATTLKQLFEFLDVPADDNVIERVFRSEHGQGPGDYKIDFSGSIAVDSIGRGATLPEHMGEAQIKRINELLAELDYPTLDAGRRGSLGALLGLKRTARAGDAGRETADWLVRRLEDRGSDALDDSLLETLPITLVMRHGNGEQTVVIVGEDGKAAIVDETESQTGGGARVRCTGDVLLRVVEGEITFARAVHESLIRVEVGDTPAEERPRRPHRMLATLAALIRADA